MGNRLAVLVSGTGSNLQAILDAVADGRLGAEVALVVSNNPDAFALDRAAEAGVASIVRPQGSTPRRTYDAELARELASHDIDLVVLAGWDRLLSSEFVSVHPVINLHPAAPGAYPGLGAIERCFAAWKRGEETAGGVMVHFVPDEGVDDGPTIVWEEVPFETEDTLNTFEQRVHAVEHRLIVEAVVDVLSRPGDVRLR